MRKTDKPVGILGAGSFGWTLAHILCRNGKEVLIWSRDPAVVNSINEKGENPKRFREFPIHSKITATENLQNIFQNCKLIFVAIPTQSFRDVINKSSKFIEGDHIIVSASKGLELNTGKRMTEIIKEQTCCRKIGVLSGPNLAREILEGYPSGAIIASNLKEVQEKVYSTLHSPFFRIYLSYDVIGVELAGALKNVYAIAAGILETLDFKTNSLAFLLSRSASEMVRFGNKFGAKSETFFGLAGIGDLFATALSYLSRNKRFGKLVAQGIPPSEALDKIGEVVEGYPTTKIVYNTAVELGIRMNIAEAVYKILYLNLDIPSAVKELLQYEIKEEF